MQDCFRKHPEIYGEEIDDDEAEVDDSPLTTTEVTVSTDGLDGNSPKAPVTEPPAHSPIPSQTHENNPSKGE
jgi:mitochondrial intermembrane space import and assembly protein 40